MTTDPRQMTPDELNREAAIGVMGWVPFVDDSDTQTYPCYRVSTITDTVMIARSAYHSFCPWSPATSIADAWELVEKMASPECMVDIMGSGEDWSCTIVFASTGRGITGHAASAPRAITIAAIMAKREESK